MQQKIIIGRWLLLNRRCFCWTSPRKAWTSGTPCLDLLRILREIAAEGMAIVVVSSDFDELLGLCSRVVVISDGATIADLPTEYSRRGEADAPWPRRAPRWSGPAECSGTLAEEVGGAGFWALIDGARLCCLDAVVPKRRRRTQGFAPAGCRSSTIVSCATPSKRNTGGFVREATDLDRRSW